MENKPLTVSLLEFQTATNVCVPTIKLQAYVNQNHNIKIEDDADNISFSAGNAQGDLEFADHTIALQAYMKQENDFKIENDTHNISFSSDTAYAGMEFQDDNAKIDDTSEIVYANENQDFQALDNVHNTIDNVNPNNELTVDEALNSLIDCTSEYLKLKYQNNPHIVVTANGLNYNIGVGTNDLNNMPEIAYNIYVNQNDYPESNDSISIFSNTSGTTCTNQSSNFENSDVVNNIYQPNYWETINSAHIVGCAPEIIQNPRVYQVNYLATNDAVNNNQRNNFLVNNFPNTMFSEEDEKIHRIRNWAISHNVSNEQTDSLLQILHQRVLPHVPVPDESFINIGCSPLVASDARPGEQKLLKNEEIIVENDLKSLLKNNHVDNSMNYIKFKTKYNMKLPVDTVDSFVRFDTRIKVDNDFHTDLKAFIASRLFHFDQLYKVLLPIFQLVLTKNVTASFHLTQRTRYSNKIVFLQTAFSQCLKNTVLEYRQFCSKDLSEVDYINAIHKILYKNICKCKCSCIAIANSYNV